MVINAVLKDEEVIKDMLKNLQQDVLARLSNARVGQAVGEVVRQTDLVLRDHNGRFVVLCPETDLESASFLAKRIKLAVEERTGLHVTYGAASFPSEALTFEDLLYIARDRSRKFLDAEMFIEKKEQVMN